VSKLRRRLYKLPRPLGRGYGILRRGFSQNKKGEDPIGFSRKAKAKRNFFLLLGLKPDPDKSEK
jgi:hypothetical protein